MATYRGIIFIKGTIGGINFYDRLGKPTLREGGGGFTREAIKNSPRMVRVRENNDEFSGASRTNKYFKQSIRPFTIGYKDNTLHSRLMQLFTKIKDADQVSKRGERQVSLGMTTDTGKHLLQHFVFTPNRPDLFPCDYAFDWDSLTLHVAGFQAHPADFPKEASYMEVLLGLVRFDFETKSYTQVVEAPLILERDSMGDAFSMSVSALPSGTGTVFAMARVAFYQMVNGEGYLLSGGNAFGVQVVGI